MGIFPVNKPFSSAIRILRSYGSVDVRFLAKQVGASTEDMSTVIDTLEDRGVVEVNEDGTIKLVSADTEKEQS